MKRILFLILLLTGLISTAQVTITSNDLPNEGDVLIQKVAILTSGIDLEESGANHTWTFDEDLLQSLDIINETPCLSVSESPLLYQFLFNNPFDPEHNADFAFGVDDIDIAGLITFTDVYWYYQNNSDEYTAVGQGVTINEIPLPTQADPIDVIYELPIQFNDESTSNSALEMEIPKLFTYKLEQTRTNVVDGWGTLNIWGVDYDVLRVRTEIAATDSVFIEALGFGQSIDRPLVVEYKWLSPAYNVPVLQITTTAGFISSVLIADIFVGLDAQEFSSLEIFPNPATDKLIVKGITNESTTARIFSSQGQLIKSLTLNAGETINVHDLASGSYNIELQSGSAIFRKPFVKN